MILRLPSNGVQRLLLVKSLHQYSTTAVPAQPETHFLADYLINSLGFSREAAATTSKKVRCKSTRKNPDSVLEFFQKLGLNKTQIQGIVFTQPVLLLYDADKTLQPKIKVLQDLGISGSNLVKVLSSYKSFLSAGLESQIRPPIEYLRNLLGSDEKIAKAVTKCPSLLHVNAPKLIAANVMLLQKIGFSKENVSSFLLCSPPIFLRKTEMLTEVLSRVENEYGISRESKVFYGGVLAVSQLNKSTIDMKLGVLRSFGWSDATVCKTIRNFPRVLHNSEDKMRKTLNFLVKEHGYTPDYLATYPFIFSLNFEKRVKPRSEILKILNEKKLNKRKTGLYSVLCMTDSEFVNNYLLPYKDEIPDLYDSKFVNNYLLPYKDDTSLMV